MFSNLHFCCDNNTKMQVQLPNKSSEGHDQLDGNWRGFDDSYKSFTRLNKKVKTEKLLKNFAKQVQTQWSSEQNRDTLRKSLNEIKAQFDAEEGIDVLHQTTVYLESHAHLTELKRDIILQEILLFAQLLALKTVQGSVKCSATLAISQLRKLGTFWKEIQKERLETEEARTKFDQIKSILEKGEKHCKLATEYMNQFDSASENRQKELLKLIRQQRDLILNSYNEALKKMNNLQVKVEGSHFTLLMAATEQNAAQCLNLKIVGTGATNVLKGRFISLAYVAAHTSAALGDFLMAGMTKGIKAKVAQLEQDLEDLTKLINEIKMIEQKAQQFIDSHATLNSKNWFENSNL